MLGPLNIVVFVEAGFELYQGHHLLSIFCCTDECCDDRRIFGGAVEGHLDPHHEGIVCRLIDEFLDRCGK